MTRPDPSLVGQTAQPIIRDEAGRFAPGTRGGPGRTDLADRGRYLRAVKAAVTHDDLVDVLTAMVKAAKGGDVPAGRLICEYTLGRPAQSITVGTEDGPAYKLLIGVDPEASS